MKRIPILLLLVAVALLSAPAAIADAGPDGTVIFKAKCAMCHGPDGKGQTAMGKNLHLRDMGSDEVQNMKNADMQKMIADGKGKMPAFKEKLDQASIDALIGFIRTLKK